MAAVVIFAIYSSMTKSAATSLNETTNESVAKIRTKTQEAINSI